MKVFISWSGEKSRMAAEALKDWLPSLIQAVDPWISSEDIAKGARWFSDLSKQLEHSMIGIICLTADNMQSPWVLFEAGAVAKTLSESYVCPWLIDFTESGLKGPLIQFQATKAEKNDTRKLVHTINAALGDNRIEKERLDHLYDILWPQLEEKLNTIIDVSSDSTHEEPSSMSDMMSEMLGHIRDLKRESLTREDALDSDALLKERVARFEAEEKLYKLELEYKMRKEELKLMQEKERLKIEEAYMELDKRHRDLQTEHKKYMESKKTGN